MKRLKWTKRLDEMTATERAEYAKKVADTSDRLATFSLYFSIVACILIIIAYLDKIVLFVRYVIFRICD